MMRIMGAVLVAAVCAWLGFQAADGLRRRLQAMKQMVQALGLLERELDLGAPPLPQLLERVAGLSAGSARRFLEGCQQDLSRLDTQEFSSLWSAQVEHQAELGQEGQAILTSLGAILGRYDAQAQREAVAAARRHLEELVSQGEQERRRQGRVYQVLGLSGGAFLVILLL